MDDNIITLYERIVESSPTIVLLLLAGYFFFGRLGYLVIIALLTRLDKKDADNATMQREMLEAVNEMREAVAQLTLAIRDER